MTVVKYLLNSIIAFLDVWSGANYAIGWGSFLLGALLIIVTVFMYALIYWRVVSPKCYSLRLCALLTFLICVAIYGTFILLCIGGEWIIRAVF